MWVFYVHSYKGGYTTFSERISCYFSLVNPAPSSCHMMIPGTYAQMREDYD